MKTGSFVIYEKHQAYLEFRTPVDFRSFSQNVYVDIDTLKVTLGDWFFYRVCKTEEKLLENILFPTKECKKESYEIGDEIFYQSHAWSYSNVIKFGTVTGKQNELYVIDEEIRRRAHQLIPYNWYSLHAKCKCAIKWWLLISRRLHVCKDMRKLIASYIWRLRNEYAWDCNHKHSKRRTAHKKIKYYGE